MLAIEEAGNWPRVFGDLPYDDEAAPTPPVLAAARTAVGIGSVAVAIALLSAIGALLGFWLFVALF